MSNAKLRFYFREPTIDTNIPITDGTVKMKGFDWEFVDNEDDADAWDCGFAARVRAYAKGLPHISIPAFPNRKFRLAYIFVNSQAGIETAKEGQIDLPRHMAGIILHHDLLARATQGIPRLLNQAIRLKAVRRDGTEFTAEHYIISEIRDGRRFFGATIREVLPRTTVLTSPLTRSEALPSMARVSSPPTLSVTEPPTLRSTLPEIIAKLLPVTCPVELAPTRVNALSQLFGGPPSSAGSAQVYQSRLGLSREDRDSRNQGCCDDV